MTKTHQFAVSTGWERIADFHVSVGDKDADNQQFDQLALLREGSVLQTGPDSLAKIFHMPYQARKFVLTLDLGHQLFHLVLQTSAALLDLLPSALVFRQRYDTAQIGFGQTIELLFQAGLPAPQVLLARLQFLRQPLTRMRSLHGPGDRLGILQQIA